MKKRRVLDVCAFHGLEKKLLSSHACVVKIAKTWHPWPTEAKKEVYDLVQRQLSKGDAVSVLRIAALILHYKLCFKNADEHAY